MRASAPQFDSDGCDLVIFPLLMAPVASFGAGGTGRQTARLLAVVARDVDYCGRIALRSGFSKGQCSAQIRERKSALARYRRLWRDGGRIALLVLIPRYGYSCGSGRLRDLPDAVTGASRCDTQCR